MRLRGKRMEGSQLREWRGDSFFYSKRAGPSTTDPATEMFGLHVLRTTMFAIWRAGRRRRMLLVSCEAGVGRGFQAGTTAVEWTARAGGHGWPLRILEGGKPRPKTDQKTVACNWMGGEVFCAPSVIRFRRD